MKRVVIVLVLIAITIGYAYYEHIAADHILAHLWASLSRIMVGYSISVVASFLTALALSFLPGIQKYVRVYLNFLISIPTIAWIPLLLIVTGISNRTMIIAIFLGSYFAIVFNLLDAFKTVDKNLVLLGFNLEYKQTQRLMRIMVPASLNTILVSLKLGISYSWRALIGAEMLGAATRGLGYLSFASRQFYDLKTMFTALVLIGLIGYFLIQLLTLYVEENTIRKWGFHDHTV